LKMNRVIIRDANLFSAMNEFSKKFCWLRHYFSDKLIFRIWSIIVDWKVQKHDRIYDFVWFNENDHDFHERNQFNDSIRASDQ
jgi:hypothetical protein